MRGTDVSSTLIFSRSLLSSEYTVSNCFRFACSISMSTVETPISPYRLFAYRASSTAIRAVAAFGFQRRPEFDDLHVDEQAFPLADFLLRLVDFGVVFVLKPFQLLGIFLGVLVLRARRRRPPGSSSARFLQGQLQCSCLVTGSLLSIMSTSSAGTSRYPRSSAMPLAPPIGSPIRRPQIASWPPLDGEA